MYLEERESSLTVAGLGHIPRYQAFALSMSSISTK
jgi:hypothetical protein